MGTALKNIVIKKGIFLGIAMIIFNFTQYTTGVLYTSNTGLSILLWLVGAAMYTLFITWGIQQYKTANNGQLAVVDGLKIGVLIGVIAGIFSAIYSVVYTTYLDPNYYEKVVELALEKMAPLLQRMSEDEVMEFQQGLFEGKPTVISTFIYAIIGSSLGGLILGVIIGLIKKTKNSD